MELFTSSAEGGLRTAREEEAPAHGHGSARGAGLQTIITSLTSLGLVEDRKWT